MAKTVKLTLEPLKFVRTVNDKLASYNIEMTEVTGGTFWKAYTPEQTAGTEKFWADAKAGANFDMVALMQYYDPIDLYNERLRKLAKEYGPAWVRVSGSWATKTCYDFEGTGVTPEGYLNHLTKEQWIGVLDFVKAVDGRLLVSMCNCDGLHKASEPWNPSQAEKIFKLSKEYGVPIEAVEFVNEPNLLDTTGFPVGYTAKDYARDQDIFHKWLRENYPGVLVVGPSATEDTAGDPELKSAGGVAGLSGNLASTDELMEGTTEKLDVFSYHYYNGISERLEYMMPAMRWSPDSVLTERYLRVASSVCQYYMPMRDKFCPDGEMWVTESGEAAGGGSTWSSTYTDVFRSLNEFGTFALLTDGVIFHNTLASSDYGYIQHGTFDPRPNYFAVVLWNRIMGNTVFDSGIEIQEGAHVFAHSRKDGKEGTAYLVINNSETDCTTVELPKSAEVYKLSAENLRSTVMKLNGRDLTMNENNDMPDLSPVTMEGKLVLEPATMAFIVI